MHTSIGDEPVRFNPAPIHRLSIVYPLRWSPPNAWGEELTMGGRKFAQYNKADPEPVVRLLAKAPQCFDVAGWRLYLLDVHRGTLNDAANRQRLIRGELPAYCAECTPDYRLKMQAQGKCHPPASTEPVGAHKEPPESEARASDRTRAEAAGANSEQRTDASGLLAPAPTGNARIGFSAPASVFALAGCKGVA